MLDIWNWLLGIGIEPKSLSGLLLKGRSDVIIRDGEVLHPAARANDFSENDILEDVRLNGRVADVSEVALAYLERDGNISVVPARKG